jgi:hypothetical protein
MRAPKASCVALGCNETGAGGHRPVGGLIEPTVLDGLQGREELGRRDLTDGRLESLGYRKVSRIQRAFDILMGA